MSSITLDRPTVHLSDIEGNTAEVEFVDGKPIKEYFDELEGALAAPVEGQTAFVNGIPLDLSDTLETGTELSVGVLARNG